MMYIKAHKFLVFLVGGHREHVLELELIDL
jgi:hypothetical protein